MNFIPDSRSSVERPFPIPDIETLPAEQVRKAVPAGAGARPLDRIDREYLQAGPNVKPRPSTTK